MTREEHLRFCKICKNQGFDSKFGIICSLTGRRADFDLECDHFVEDQKLKAEQKVKDREKAVNGNIAGLEKRLVNYLLDSVFLLFFGLTGLFIWGVLLSLISPSTFAGIDPENRIFNYSIAFVVGMIYYSIFEFASGRTIAKYITKTRVVDQNGNL